MSWLLPALPWIKAAHVVSIVAWMAGQLYLPRLFVYHAGAAPDSDTAATFKVMERRLYRGIMWPALVGTFLFGILLAATPGVVDWRQGWIWVKLLGVAGLTVTHYLDGHWLRAFAADRNRRPARFYRLVNEVPTLLLILIVVMVAARPF